MNASFDSMHHRRGVLMLVVVSMLTLFLMLGTTYLVVAARAKQAARAQARLAMDSSSIGIAPARLLDGVLLKVVRGETGGVSAPTYLSGTLAGLGCNVSFESLLADKYGDGQTVSGTAESIAPVANAPLLTGTLKISGVQSADLPGRLLTLLGNNREPTSHRILSGSTTGSGTYSVVLSNPSRRRPFVLPTSAVDAKLNGLEFADTSGNEPYDAFDDKNAFLAHVSPKDATNTPNIETVAGSTVKKFGYVQSGTNPTLQTLSGSTASNGLDYGADNDNDGTPDGFFLNFGLPSVPAPGGVGTVDFHASVLVVDLDSRFNVNAHGSLAPLMYLSGTTGQHPGWSTDALAPSPSTLPMGSGYGPPEIAFRWMFPQASYPSDGPRKMRYAKQNKDGDSDDWRQIRSDAYLLSGADVAVQKTGVRPKSSRFTPSATLPVIPDMEGRYAEKNAVCVSSTLSTSSHLNDSACQVARPGAPGANDLLSAIVLSGTTLSGSNALSGTANLGFPETWWSGTTSSEDASRRTFYNSPPDLQGSMLMTTATASDVVPRFVFSKPEWGDGEAKDDPYELRLDPRAARTGSLMTNDTRWDNVFGYAELETLLRQYDGDGQRLPRRLLQLLGASGEEARLRVTTDGWDTTLITGTASTTIRNWLKALTVSLSGTSATSGIIANEIARGERLNLNRPLTPTKPTAYDPTHPYYIQRQALFKDLYTLLTALGVSASAADRAQWAANVVEFRDADSTITPFEYDTDFANGWNVDNNPVTTGDTDRGVVWGAERPEILIAETSAWENDSTGELYVAMHRPWEAWALASGSNKIPAEPVDAQLDYLSGGTTTNQVDLGKKSSEKSYLDTATYPIWRLRIKDAGGNISYVRFDTNTGSSGMFAVTSATSASTTPRLGAGEWLCVTGGTLAPSTTLPTVAVTSPSVLRVPGTLPTTPLPSSLPTRSATVYLERLSDPSGTVSSSVWSQDPETAFSVPMYRIVDSGTIQVVNRYVTSPATPPSPSVTTRQATTFWKGVFNAAQNTDYSFKPAHVTASGSAAWFVWPNRPFASAAELLLVPQGDSLGILTGYTKPMVTANDLLTLTGTKFPLFMEAVHVPTRFAGIHTTINASGTAALASYGIYPETTPVNQISSYREPGRVNLNTITTDDVWNAVVAGSLTASGSANPVKTRASANFDDAPATSAVNLLALSASGTTAIKDTNSALAAIQPRNPLHEIYTATRLANTATTRSNVFAIWVTVRESIAGDPDSVKLHRGFYIVDRSIPVAYEPGKDHNVWDCVVLRRIIE